jgi:hypothetical protein
MIIIMIIPLILHRPTFIDQLINRINRRISIRSIIHSSNINTHIFRHRSTISRRTNIQRNIILNIFILNITNTLINIIISIRRRTLLLLLLLLLLINIIINNNRRRMPRTSIITGIATGGSLRTIQRQTASPPFRPRCITTTIRIIVRTICNMRCSAGSENIRGTSCGNRRWGGGERRGGGGRRESDIYDDDDDDDISSVASRDEYDDDDDDD